MRENSRVLEKGLELFIFVRRRIIAPGERRVNRRFILSSLLVRLVKGNGLWLGKARGMETRRHGVLLDKLFEV
jgi:hypothetical protein